MNSASLTKPKLSAGYEPLPGYTLEEMIGRGGFGEVWRVNAPGDLKKAIKFVFGHQDGSRATRELRSLERVKAVRHPFLLTLERFEIVDEQLIIVTELADGSLEEIYKRHRKTGSCGIPRDVLLKNLHDTADGLDYLHVEYQLQHLDVKPANLLMVGGHVKVADFGLLKDLRDIDCSVVGGLTPIYAPPELFDGRPSMHSDQYSLAVMYQEMLTGTRPFAGRTIAQLATQHIHSTPNLEPLPPRDRSVIAKALEKDPSRRFESCSELIDALKSSRRISTQGIVADDPSEVSAAIADVQDLPQIEDGQSDSTRRATGRALVIGIGGTGADCLSELRRKAASLHVACPLEMTMVLVDTDATTIHGVRVSEASDRVPKCRAIHTPLRKATDYRMLGTERLRTISRRWIYNVPRSGETEGLRPVGRLALVDHGREVVAGLRDAIEAFKSNPGEEMHVYVVGSISGGTCSGMYIDLVHQLRHLLDEANLHDLEILSLLSSTPMRGDGGPGLPTHNSHAALIEIRHFLKAGNGYPGDAGAGFASVPAARTPLQNIYVMAGSHQEKYSCSPVDTIVDYLWCNSTGAGSFLKKARRLDSDGKKSASGSSVIQTTEPTIRSVGIIPLGEGHGLEQQLLAPAIVYQVLVDWLGNPSTASSIASSVADRIARRIGLTPQYVIGSIIDTISSRDEDDNRTIVPERLRSAASDGSVDFIAGGLTNQLHREISIALGDRKYNVAALIESLRAIRELCSTMPKTWRETLEGKNQDLCRHADAIARLAADSLRKISEECLFLQERMECLAAVLAVSAVTVKQRFGAEDPWESMPPRTASGKDGIITLIHQTTVNTHLVRPLNDTDSNLDPESLVEHLSEVTMPYLVSWLNQNADEFESDMGSSVFQGGGPSQTYRGASNTKALDGTLVSPMPTAVDVTQQIEGSDSTGADTAVLSVEDAVTVVRPQLMDFGGSQRLILMVGSAAERTQFESKIRETHEGILTVKVVDDKEPMLVHEAQGISLNSILTRLEVLNGETSSITGRLSSRIDVQWAKN